LKHDVGYEFQKDVNCPVNDAKNNE